MYKYLLVFGLLNFVAFAAFAQKPDTVAVKNKADSATRVSDSLKTKRVVPTKIKKEKIYHPDSLHSPHKAVMHSLMIPGWGQAYNHQWWKVPIVYAGIGLLVDAIIFNEKGYSEFVTLAKYNEKGYIPKPTDKYYAEYNLYYNTYRVSASAIVDASNSYRRNRDLSILGTLAAWSVQTIDAYIDAKFKQRYTMDNNLSLKIAPDVGEPIYTASTNNVSLFTGLKVTFTF